MTLCYAPRNDVVNAVIARYETIQFALSLDCFAALAMTGVNSVIARYEAIQVASSVCFVATLLAMTAPRNDTEIASLRSQ